MSIVDRLEKSLEFLKAKEWGHSSDRVELLTGEVAYCARGAVVYGGLAGLEDTTWCLSYAHWHTGPCHEGENYCDNNQRVDVDEFTQVMNALDLIASEEASAVDRWCWGVTDYNDLIAKSKDDVIAVFEKAIARAKESQG